MEEEEGMQDGGVLNERSEERKSAEEIGDKETERIGDREIDREGTGDREMEVESAGDRKMEGEHAGDSKMEGESVRDREKDGEKEGASSLSSEGSWSPSPHPIFSRMHMHSSVSSSSSSFNCSSAESDDVFSEGEDTASKRSTMRRCRSWRTFLTVMQWSVRRQNSWVQLAGHQGMCPFNNPHTSI